MKTLKHLLILFFAGVYLVTSTGVMVNYHFCCGKLKSVSFSIPDSCCKDGESAKGCCKNVAKYFKVKDKQLAGEKKAEFGPMFIFVPEKAINFSPIYSVLNPEESVFVIYDPPPLHDKTPLFIKKRHLLI